MLERLLLRFPTIETELMEDAADELRRVGGALAFRHGDAFRALERDIEALAEREWTDADVAYARLDDAHYVLLPPPEMRAAIATARALGL